MLGLASLQPTPSRHSPHASTGFGIKRHKVAQTVAATEPIQPPPAIAKAEFAKPRTGFMKSKASAQSAPPKSAIELTSDGFVKWWK